MAPTNKPCSQHTETSGGQSGHTSRTPFPPPKERIPDAPHTKTEQILGGGGGGPEADLG